MASSAGYVYVKKNPDWIVKKENKYLDDKIIRDTYEFFVIHSPCVELTARGIYLAEYGWHNPWAKPYCLNKQLKSVMDGCGTICSANTLTKMEGEINNANLPELVVDGNGNPTNYSDKKEAICIYNSKNNQFMSIWAHLRNALAHGRFTLIIIKRGKYIYAEDVIQWKYKTVLTARLCLRMTTLEKWISLISSGEQIYNIQS